MPAYNIFKSEVMKKSIDLINDTIKVALLDNSHTFDPDTTANTQWSDVSVNEVSGTGYSAGGQTLTNPTVTPDNTDDKAYFDADDPEWTGATITAYHAVIYDDTTATKFLIASIDLGGEQQVTAGTFTINWDENGIVAIG